MAADFVARIGGSKWLSALPTGGSKWVSALPTGGSKCPSALPTGSRWVQALPADAQPASFMKAA